MKLVRVVITIALITLIYSMQNVVPEECFQQEEMMFQYDNLLYMHDINEIKEKGLWQLKDMPMQEVSNDAIYKYFAADIKRCNADFERPILYTIFRISNGNLVYVFCQYNGITNMGFYILAIVETTSANFEDIKLFIEPRDLPEFILSNANIK